MTVLRSHPRPALVPELYVTALPASLAFWRDLLGFKVLYERPEQGFAAIERDGVEFMLEEYETGPTERCWDTGTREKPYGRGINFEIMVSDTDVLLAALRRTAWPLFFGPEERWYRISDTEETGVHQFLVQDPDGYLLRFSQPLGRRLLPA